MKKLLLRLSLMVALSVALSQPLIAQQGQIQLMDVDGRKVRMRIAGAGVPTVVLESGLGGGLGDWNSVFDDIARVTRVVAYDRAGYGQSEPGPEPRSYAQIANELRAALKKAGIAPPYVLVGHSLGGALIRGYASAFKDDVAGLVFVDPISENMFKALTPAAREAAVAQQDAASQNGSPGERGEWAFLKSEAGDFPQLSSLGKPPDVPMVVLVAGRDRPPHWVETVFDLYGKWVANASEGSLMMTSDSSHYIQRDEPALVVAAIRRVVFPSVQNALERALKQGGANAVIARYRVLRRRYPGDLFKERMLNTLGYQQLSTGRAADAIALFKLNTEMYPDSANTYDSLAEAYAAHGETDAAIANYRKTLSMNPDNPHAVEMLKKLGGG